MSVTESLIPEEVIAPQLPLSSFSDEYSSEQSPRMEHFGS